MSDKVARPPTAVYRGVRPVGSHGRTPEPSRTWRHLFLSELDGPDYDAAVDAADAYVADKERGLYGDRDHDQRIGWQKEDVA